jgi:parallel beta-helix repeat protein
MRYTLVLFFLINATISFASNYYVSPAGSDWNNGLSTSFPFQTLQHAADLTFPGDTVFVMTGTYTNMNTGSNILNIYNSGTASKWIVYKNYPGSSPIIKLHEHWAGIQVQGADYVVIDGFTVIGNNDAITFSVAQSQKNNLNNPATSGNGIGCAPEYNNPSNKSHHVIVRNCTVSKCGGGGIYSTNADYLQIENNTISECGWYSPYGNSGISLYQNWNSDSSTGIKNYITGNTCYRNEEYIPFYAAGRISDGNGIIIDDGRNTQNGSALGAYAGKTYIANNLVFDNGGRGIHCYESDNVIIVNNTCFYNCQSPAVKDGEYTAYDTDSIFFINNIAYPSIGISPIDKSSSTTTNLIVDHNLWAANAYMAHPFGTNTVTGLLNLSDPSLDASTADFHLRANSIAINSGTHYYAPLIDKDGNNRQVGDSVDIGCYEFQSITGIIKAYQSENLINVYPNPASNTISFKVDDDFEYQVEVSIFNSIGINIKTIDAGILNGLVLFNISDLKNGIYIIQLKEKRGEILSGRFVKTY